MSLSIRQFVNANFLILRGETSIYVDCHRCLYLYGVRMYWWGGRWLQRMSPTLLLLRQQRFHLSDDVHPFSLHTSFVRLPLDIVGVITLLFFMPMVCLDLRQLLYEFLRLSRFCTCYTCYAC